MTATTKTPTFSFSTESAELVGKLARQSGLYDSDAHLEWALDASNDQGKLMCPVTSYLSSLKLRVLELLRYDMSELEIVFEGFEAQRNGTFKVKPGYVNLMSHVVESAHMKELILDGDYDAEQASRILTMMMDLAQK